MNSKEVLSDKRWVPFLFMILHPQLFGFGLMQRLLAGAALEQAAHHHKKHGHKHHRQDGAGQHAADHPGADGALAG